MGRSQLTAAWVREIYRRQIPPRWGPDYLTSQQATPAEAPSVSRSSRMFSSRLQRYVHAVSTPESSAIPFALYHPKVFELQEGLIMRVSPADHPLVGHPRASGLRLPTTSGTAAIAERLGFLSRHPKVKETLVQRNGERLEQWLPAPWVLDPMLYLDDAAGPFCVSWDVKSRPEDHAQPGPGNWVERSSPQVVRQAEARDAVYREYMRELAIPIVRVAQSDIPRALAVNLRRLLLAHSQPLDLPPALHAEILEGYDQILRAGEPPTKVIARFERRGVRPELSKRCLEHAIYERRIRIDLYRDWRVDQPLEPEVRDPLVVMSNWFSR